MDNWEFIRALHSYATETPPHVVDLVANERIIKSYAMGLGVTDIATSLGLEPEDVLKTLQYYYTAFTTRLESLPFNPLKFYKRAYGDMGNYMDECEELSISPKDCYDSYMICLFFNRYRKELQIYDGN